MAFAGLSSTSIAAGNSVSVDFWNANFGPGAAPASATRLYISTDATITTSDTVLATLNSSGLTGHGGSNWYDHRAVSVTLPNGLAPGTYFVGAIADHANAIAEGDETNNTWNVTQISVLPSQSPDTFVFAQALGHQAVSNFDPGFDVIELPSALFPDAASVLAAASDDGQGNTVIGVDANNSFTLDGILKTQLSASDFHIV